MVIYEDDDRQRRRQAQLETNWSNPQPLAMAVLTMDLRFIPSATTQSIWMTIARLKIGTNNADIQQQ